MPIPIPYVVFFTCKFFICSDFAFVGFLAVIPIIISLPQTYHSIVTFGVLDDIVRILYYFLFIYEIYHNFIKIPFTDVFLELYDCSIAAQLTTWLIFLTQTSVLRFDIAALKRYTRQQSWRLFRSSFSNSGWTRSACKFFLKKYWSKIGNESNVLRDMTVDDCNTASAEKITLRKPH